MIQLPQLFLDRLKDVVLDDQYESCLNTFSQEKIISIRVNTLKADIEEVCAFFDKENISFEKVKWCPEAMLLKGVKWNDIRDYDIFSQGIVYKQSLSSMLPPLVLSVAPGDNVLDMCAAPGSKTTQMAAMMNNTGSITAVEIIKGRMYKLRSVAKLLGADNISFKLMDGRRFRSETCKFDKILVDAPCSSEGRFSTLDKKSCAYWSVRKIKEMRKKQRGLLLNAVRLLASDGVLVYSTCTFAPEENEGVIDWLLRKMEGKVKVQKIAIEGFDLPVYPALESWQSKKFNKEVKKCLRILPSSTSDGFFVVKIQLIP